MSSIVVVVVGGGGGVRHGNMVTWQHKGGGGGCWLLVVMSPSILTWYEYELQSLNLQTRMRTKVSWKMIILVKTRVGFDFSKMIFFQFIFILF